MRTGRIERKTAETDIRVEVTVYEPASYEQGVRLTRQIHRNAFGSSP